MPSFPDTSQETIKDAVSEESDENEVVNLPHSEKTFKTVELEEWSPSSASPFSQAQIQPSSSAARPISPASKNEVKSREQQSDIYIKIDKFYSAKRALDAAEQKLEEIDGLLKKIRETKLREEQELSAWEKDITALKGRVKEVTDTLLEKA